MYFIGPLTEFDIYKSNDFSSGTSQPGKERACHIKYFIIEDVGVPGTKKWGEKKFSVLGRLKAVASFCFQKWLLIKGTQPIPQVVVL